MPPKATRSQAPGTAKQRRFVASLRSIPLPSTPTAASLRPASPPATPLLPNTSTTTESSAKASSGEESKQTTRIPDESVPPTSTPCELNQSSSDKSAQSDVPFSTPRDQPKPLSIDENPEEEAAARLSYCLTGFSGGSEGTHAQPAEKGSAGHGADHLWSKVRDSIGGDLKELRAAATAVVEGGDRAVRLARRTSLTADDVLGRTQDLKAALTDKSRETTDLLNKIAVSLHGTPSGTPWATPRGTPTASAACTPISSPLPSPREERAHSLRTRRPSLQLER